MAVGIGTSVYFTFTGTSGSGTYTNAGESLLVILCAMSGSGPAGTTCTVNGVSATFASNTSGGGYCGTVVLYLANPTSGTVTVTKTGSSVACVTYLVPITGANLASPLSTVVGGTQNTVNNPSSGNITGVDTNGLYLGMVNCAYNSNTITSESTGWTAAISGVQQYLTNNVSHIAYISGVSSPQVYQPTLLNGGSNSASIGLYINSGTQQAMRVRRTRTIIPVFYPR